MRHKSNRWTKVSSEFPPRNLYDSFKFPQILSDFQTERFTPRNNFLERRLPPACEVTELSQAKFTDNKQRNQVWVRKAQQLSNMSNSFHKQ